MANAKIDVRKIQLDQEKQLINLKGLTPTEIQSLHAQLNKSQGECKTNRDFLLTKDEDGHSIPLNQFTPKSSYVGASMFIRKKPKLPEQHEEDHTHAYGIWAANVDIHDFKISSIQL